MLLRNIGTWLTRQWTVSDRGKDILNIQSKPVGIDFIVAKFNVTHFRATQRRVLVKPVFQDFDRHNNGHVTRHQFRQCLTTLELHCTEAEMQALEAKFCNDTGFNYLAFLSELEPQEPSKLLYVERLKEIRTTNRKSALPQMAVATDLEGVMNKIKTKVYKERIRVLEWMRDYDKLHCGRMHRTNFQRALDLCKFELAQSEVCIEQR